MKHRMNLNDAPFRMIKSGEKTIELRLIQSLETERLILHLWKEADVEECYRSTCRSCRMAGAYKR